MVSTCTYTLFTYKDRWKRLEYANQYQCTRVVRTAVCTCVLQRLSLFQHAHVQMSRVSHHSNPVSFMRKHYQARNFVLVHFFRPKKFDVGEAFAETSADHAQQVSYAMHMFGHHHTRTQTYPQKKQFARRLHYLNAW